MKVSCNKNRHKVETKLMVMLPKETNLWAAAIIIALLLTFVNTGIIFAQTENVGIGTATPDNAAVLELSISGLSSPKGFLAPRMTTLQRGSIPGPLPPGLMIYNTDNSRFQYYNGTSWLDVIATGFTFADIATGTNTSATMTVGDGASLLPSGTGFVQSNRFVGSGSTSNAVDLASAEVNGTLAVPNGGTGLNSAPGNGQLLIGNGTDYTLANITAGSNVTVTNGAGSIQISAALPTLTDGNIWVGDATNQPAQQTVSGDATLTNAGVLTLANSGVTAGVYGTAARVPQITVDAKGRLTNVSNIDISGVSPVGSLLNDGQIWVGNASNQAAAVAVSGDISLSNAGVVSINNNTVAGEHINLTGNLNGDLMQYNGTDWVRLAPGANGEVLKVSGGIPGWGADDNSTYTAGNGLTLTGNQFAADFSGTGTANRVARSDHNHETLTRGNGLTGNNYDGTAPTTWAIDFAGTGVATTVSRSDHSHSIATSITATPWRVFYSDAAGAINELALGANGTVLQSTGANSAPAWANIALPAGNNNQTLRHDGSAWTASDNLINTESQIGIGGITSPVSTLHQDEGTATASFHKFTAGTTTGQTASDGFDLGITATGQAELRQRENLDMAFYTDNTERMNINDDGKIGFGISTPSGTYTYEFNGSTKIEGNLEVTGEIDPIALILLPQATSPTQVRGKMYYDANDDELKVWNGTAWQDLGGGGGALPAATDGQTLRHNGTDWVASGNILNTGTNIGLGNAGTPVALLHQDGGDATASYHKFTAGTTTGQSASDGFDLGITATGQAELRQRENSDLVVLTDNTERMWVKGDGKIGIGDANSSPNATLDLNGTFALKGRTVINTNTGRIDNINIGDNSFVIINSSYNGTVTVTGIDGGYDGRIVIIRFLTNVSFNFSIQHLNNFSSSENQFDTGLGSYVTDRSATFLFYYDGTSEKWIPVAFGQ